MFEADDEWSLDISEKCMSEKNTYVTRLENIKNCEKINVSCFKLPSLWHFVTVAIEN